MRSRLLALSLRGSCQCRLAALSRRHLSGEVAPASGRQTDLSGLGPKRFYTSVDIEHDATNSHYAVTIDGRRVRTPRRSVLSAPTEPLALALAAEWDAQGTRIRPSSMPLTSLVSTARDVVPQFRPRITASVLKFLDTDTLCIRPDRPATLVSAQTEVYAPIVEHLRRARGLELNVAVGGLEADQTEGVRRAVGEFVQGLDDLSLAAMDSAAATCKSIAIAIALHDGEIDAEHATKAARSEEGWQEGVWGTVEGGHDLDAADTLVRLAAANNIFRFIGLDPSKFVRREFVK